FSSRRRHTRLVSDWSSDVCSSDLRRTINGNYTWSHCITDPGGDKEFNAGGIIPWLDPNNRRLDRGNCFVAATDHRHLVNLSAVEIGRASCRERVESGVVDGTLKEE